MNQKQRERKKKKHGIIESNGFIEWNNRFACKLPISKRDYIYVLLGDFNMMLLTMLAVKTFFFMNDKFDDRQGMFMIFGTWLV